MTTSTIKSITESTLLPISLVITLIGGVVWLSTIWYKADANAYAINEVKQSIKEDKQFLREDLTKINDKLDYIIDRMQK
jgi:hypothetical protein